MNNGFVVMMGIMLMVFQIPVLLGGNENDMEPGHEDEADGRIGG